MDNPVTLLIIAKVIHIFKGFFALRRGNFRRGSHLSTSRGGKIIDKRQQMGYNSSISVNYGKYARTLAAELP